MFSVKYHNEVDIKGVKYNPKGVQYKRNENLMQAL